MIETRLKKSTFKILKNALSHSVQNKFIYEEGDPLSKIIIRGLGVTESLNQIDQLTLFFGLFVQEINNFDKELSNQKN